MNKDIKEIISMVFVRNNIEKFLFIGIVGKKYDGICCFLIIKGLGLRYIFNVEFYLLEVFIFFYSKYELF